ncbi:hypothetical protein [Actinomyces oricola]|uniref:hypothetical protein n=1 Tax=Actinomyces oricola TaxID=206043 RepID=UPI000FFF5BB8|nr:hypothetical protein [Actinomyces oricola]
MIGKSKALRKISKRYPTEADPEAKALADARAVLDREGVTGTMQAIRLLRESELDYDLTTATYLVEQLGVGK